MKYGLQKFETINVSFSGFKKKKSSCKIESILNNLSIFFFKVSKVIY